MIRRDFFGAPAALLCGALGLLACGASTGDAGGTAQPNGGANNGVSGSGALGGSGGMGGNAAAGTGSKGGAGGTTAVATAGTTAMGGSGTTPTGGAGGASGAGAGGRGGSGGVTSSGGSGGASAVGGSAGAAGTGGGGKVTVCNFASGLNIAWVSFANDVPNPKIATFNTIFKNTHDAGGRIVRWWFHTNGTVTPGYDASGLAKPIPQSHIDGVKAILASAHSAGIGLTISLWSFDMLQSGAASVHTNNSALLENDTNRQAYIDRYLTPLVTALKGTPGLYAYEIFNEAEGMGPNGWSTYRTTEAAIQKTVNWFSAAIHAADPNVLVTNGAVTFDYCSKVTGKTNYYSDDQLRSVGGKQGGTLDFYQVHYYAANGAGNSPFTHSASSWGLDKKLVIGEFAPELTDGVAQNDLGKHLYENGYNGGWAWSYNADDKWPAEQGPLQTLYSAHADVGNCPLAP